LELFLPKGQILTLRLTEDMIGQLRLLLQTIEQRVDWGLDPHKSKPQDSTEQKLATDSPTGDKPPKVLH